MVVRILISIFTGVGFYVALVITVLRPYVPFATKKILLWNVVLLNSIGRPAPLYYFPDGTPIYDGSFGLMGYSWSSVLSGFVIYPLLIFVFISAVTGLLRRWRAQEVPAAELPPSPPTF